MSMPRAKTTATIRTALLPVIAFVIGLIIYLPFWRVYEKKCLEDEAANEAENEAA